MIPEDTNTNSGSTDHVWAFKNNLSVTDLCHSVITWRWLCSDIHEASQCMQRVGHSKLVNLHSPPSTSIK